MRAIRLMLLVYLMALMALAGSQAVSAHGAPLRTIHKQIGRYPLRIDYYNTPAGGGALEFSITPEDPLTGNLQYHVEAVPGVFVDAVPVRAVLEPALDASGEVHGRVNLPVSGQWLLSFNVQGPHGPSIGDIPVLAGAPPAIPEWFGWLIGLLPLAAMLSFMGLQARRASADIQEDLPAHAR